MSERFPTPLPANVVRFDELDSTATFAERLIDFWRSEDEPPLAETVIIAGHQTLGRGRGANRWASPPGGLYANWLARVAPGELAGLPIAAAVALAGAVEVLVPELAVGLKWPNDLQVRGRKLGGVLCRARSTDTDAWVTVGIGVNIAVVPELGPGDPVRPISLGALGFTGEVGDAVATLVAGFLDGVHAGLADRRAARAQWERRSVHRPGDAVRLRLDDVVVEGRFAGFGEGGELRLEVASEVRDFAAGEIVPDGAGGE